MTHRTPREAALLAALEFAIEEFEDTLPYVPEYFREKWEYDQSLARLKRALEKYSDDTPA